MLLRESFNTSNGTICIGKSSKSWNSPVVETTIVEGLRAALNLSLPLATIMVQRGFIDLDKARDFLYPSLQKLPSPFLMKGMQVAVEIISQGIASLTPIIVYGDYDVDGVTATAVLIKFFNDLGLVCQSCHPDRFNNGYGLKAELVEAMSPEKPGIVITVDCGISDLAEVDSLVQAGWQVIVTDHHQPPEQLPRAHAILNPWQEGCQFPTKDLAGVGVSFYLAMGLRTYLHQEGYWSNQPPPNLKKVLDLVAVGTISDMVPLRTVNRILAKAGLEVLANTENHGFIELLELSHIQRGQSLNHDDIAFQIGPRLNAAGRMGDAKRASTLLSVVDRQIAKQLAAEIEQENIARRELTSELVSKAMTMVTQQTNENSPCLIVHGQDWHLGLLGIISSRLVDFFAKPAIVFGGIGILKGSARSIPGINIHETIAACAEKIIGFGGHSSAAGLSLKEADLASFTELMNEAVNRRMLDRVDTPSRDVDFLVTKDTVFADLESACALLAPFGQGNPEPIFTTDKPCRLRNMQVIGKEKNHLKFSAFLAGRWLDGIGFGLADVIEKAANGEAILNLAFSIKENRFNGQVKPQLTLYDAFY